MNKEYELIKNTPEPRTRASLAKDLAALGLKPGMTVLTHTALSAIGWVNGGAVALIQALMDVLTPEGTLVMPAHSGDLSDPVYWCNPPVPPEWQQHIRDTMPAFEPDITPTRGIGIVPELFRKFPGVLRSGHPAVSFAAWGQEARFITDAHGLDYPMGDSSPLARVYDLGGSVLLLGVAYDRNTSLHLAEYRSGTMAPMVQGGPVLRDGRRIWAEFNDLDSDSDAFPAIGEAFEQAQTVVKGCVGSAPCRLINQRALVDFAAKWFRDRSNP